MSKIIEILLKKNQSLLKRDTKSKKINFFRNYDDCYR